MSLINRGKNYPFVRGLSWLFLTASILALIYTYYRAEIIYYGQLGDHYFKYYLISLAGILFWGVVLRLGEEIQANIVTLIISLVVGLYLIEGGLTFWEMRQYGSRAAAAAEFGVEYDERTKLEVIEDLIAEEVDAVPTLHPSTLIGLSRTGTNKVDIEALFPLGGVSNKLTVLDNESGKWVVYKSDRYGFNNPDSQWDEQTIEWLMIGDSFPQGYGAKPGQDVAGQIRSITRTDNISLGVGGNGPLIELASLIEYGVAVKPKKVLWMYFEGNDLLGDLLREKDSPLLMRYMEGGFSQNLINRQKEVDDMLEKYIAESLAKEQEIAQEKAQFFYKIRWIRLQAIRNVIGLDFDVNVKVDVDILFSKILAKAKASVEAWGGKLYFVYLPEYQRYNNTHIHNQYRKKSEVIAVVKELDIPVIDIHQEVFAVHPDPLSLFTLRLGGHYNEDGNREVAKAVIEKIKD